MLVAPRRHPTLIFMAFRAQFSGKLLLPELQYVVLRAKGSVSVGKVAIKGFCGFVVFTHLQTHLAAAERPGFVLKRQGKMARDTASLMLRADKEELDVRTGPTRKYVQVVRAQYAAGKLFLLRGQKRYRVAITRQIVKEPFPTSSASPAPPPAEVRQYESRSRTNFSPSSCREQANSVISINPIRPPSSVSATPSSPTPLPSSRLQPCRRHRSISTAGVAHDIRVQNQHGFDLACPARMARSMHGFVVGQKMDFTACDTSLSACGYA